jgi:hypothetical protein
MTEGIKTLIYLGVALAVGAVAFFSRPRIEEFVIEKEVNKPLFPSFADPAKADSLQIVRYDEALGTIQEFRVARDKATGAWTIPSRSGYPADAETRMRDAALLLVDQLILGVASEVPSDHRLYGVIEPDKAKLKVGDEGVGLLVRFEDKKGDPLARVVIGKKAEGTDPQWFVRIPGQDPVYVAKIDPEKLSTKFEDWIEKDLLKLNAWDVENVAIKNYTVSLQPPDGLLISNKFDLASDFKDNEWKLKELKKYNAGEATVVPLSDQEELNKEKLNELKTAVDDLQIVDVRRKPKGLGADLKAGADFSKGDESVTDLFKRGFYVGRTPGGQVELLSANGEVHVGMKEGVEYILRFGESAGTNEASKEEGENRFLFVTARVDTSKFPQPQLEALPELPAKKEAAPAADAKEAPKPAEKPAATSTDSAKPTAADESSTAAADAAAKPEAKEAAPAATAPAEKPAAGEKPAPDAGAKKTDVEAEEAKIAQERERINKENQRKIDERNEKVKKATEKVAELNTRFADWYYVVSDKQFKKIQLDLTDLIKKKETPATDAAKDEGEGIDSFHKLQQEGLKKE